MAKLPSSLVFLAITSLLCQESFGKNQLGIWLLSVRTTYTISVKEGGGVTSAPNNPTLYSLIRVRMFSSEDPETSAKFALEGVAAGHRICMTKRGQIITEDMKLKKKKKNSNKVSQVNEDNKVNMSATRRSITSIIPENCLFESQNFNSSVIYKFGKAIYSASHSNSTLTRQFIAFNRQGNLRRYKRPLNKLKNVGIVIEFIPRININELIDSTTFTRCDGKSQPGVKRFNLEMRQCIRKRKRTTILNHIRHSNILYRVIKKCQREICRLKKPKIRDSTKKPWKFD